MSCFVVFDLLRWAAIQSHFVGLCSLAFLSSHCFLASSNVAPDLVDLLTELLLSYGLFIDLSSHAVELGPVVRLGGLRALGFLICRRCFLKS